MKSNLVLFSSARKQGNTRALLANLEGHSPLNIIYLNELEIRPYDYDYNNMSDDFLDLLTKMTRCDNLIFASPVYWYSPTSQMKALLDRFTDFLDVPRLKSKGKLLREKTAYVVTTSNQLSIDTTFESIFERTFNYLGINYGGALHCQQRNLIRESAKIHAFAQRLSES